jgi:arylsulfatase A-like enzyme
MPGTIPAGKTCPQAISSVDLIATFYSFAGLQYPWAMHGRDMSALFRQLYEHTGDHYGSDVTALLRDQPKKAVYNNVPWYDAIVQDGWKYIRYLHPGEIEELYDLRHDPEELKNVAGDDSQRERLEKMRAVLISELHRTEAPYADALPKVAGE